MKAKSILGLSGVGRASVAVAGVCLSGSVASAWTTTRANDLETEFEAGNGLEVGVINAPATETTAGGIVAGEAVASVWEQTLVGYLEKLAARDESDECDECDTKAALAKALDNPDWDIEEPAAPAAAEVAIDADWDLAEAPVVVAEINPDWDLEEPTVVAANVDEDWDLEEPAPVEAAIDPDWDLAEPTVLAAAIDPDWDLAETTTVAAAPNPDWDIDEPAGPDAVAASATEDAAPPVEPKVEANPDWDIDEPIAAAPADEVTNVEATDDFDEFLIP